ncbi:MAG TPA: sigma-70 family RNA polymerase sigma factor [Pirellulales bacterium]|jgi:RNA polymerase sigma-70 factor (ECF subfamily)|nr:sigma-70 family RNA polymerase sigma factor [Pirellulales bacterium]
MSEVGPELLGRLLDEQGAALVLYARQWCSSPDDVVQEALIQLARQTQPPEKLTPWVYRVVRNGAISAARSARRRRAHETVAAERAEAWFEAAEDVRIDADLAARCLESLPLEQREVIVARLWGGLSFQEIGELVGTSSSSAHRWYEAGLQALRERLEPSCPRKTNLTN